MPLDSQELPLPPDWGQELHAARARGWHMLRSLLAPTSMAGADAPSSDHGTDANAEPQPIVTLRPYQLEGVTWLRFMRDHGLHGMLADGTCYAARLRPHACDMVKPLNSTDILVSAADMGLGKTLQALCVMAAGSSVTTPSLVVCPATLCRHWASEATKFFRGAFTPFVYVGSGRAK